jgi:hypothetical protein
MQFKEFINHNSLMLKNLFRKEILELDFSKAVENFNKQKFNQAYNILHELWKSSQSCNRKYFYQALLQTCAVFELIKQNKKDGAKRIYRSAIKKLLPFSSLTKPINIKRLIADMIEYFDHVDNDLDPLHHDIKIVLKPKILMTKNLCQNLK